MRYASKLSQVVVLVPVPVLGLGLWLVLVLVLLQHQSSQRLTCIRYVRRALGLTQRYVRSI
jgi:hypothetical protein